MDCMMQKGSCIYANGPEADWTLPMADYVFEAAECGGENFRNVIARSAGDQCAGYSSCKACMADDDCMQQAGSCIFAQGPAADWSLPFTAFVFDAKDCPAGEACPSYSTCETCLEDMDCMMQKGSCIYANGPEADWTLPMSDYVFEAAECGGENFRNVIGRSTYDRLERTIERLEHVLNL